MAKKEKKEPQKKSSKGTSPSDANQRARSAANKERKIDKHLRQVDKKAIKARVRVVTPQRSIDREIQRAKRKAAAIKRSELQRLKEKAWHDACEVRKAESSSIED